MQLEKQCKKCNSVLPVASFSKNKGKSSGYNCWCKLCLSSYQKAKYAEDIEKSRKINRERSKKHANKKSIYNRFKKYNTDGTDILIKQNGMCAICKISLFDLPEKRRHIDHDHTTGKIRGWLCQSCNQGLGNFKDSINNLKTAIAYLEAAKEKFLSV
jgi:hypothetical protein